MQLLQRKGGVEESHDEDHSSSERAGQRGLVIGSPAGKARRLGEGVE